jgi:hypothetical protein
MAWQLNEELTLKEVEAIAAVCGYGQSVAPTPQTKPPVPPLQRDEANLYNKRCKFFWKHGHCRRGDGCWYLHTEQSGCWSSPAPPSLELCTICGDDAFKNSILGTCNQHHSACADCIVTIRNAINDGWFVVDDTECFICYNRTEIFGTPSSRRSASSLSTPTTHACSRPSSAASATTVPLCCVPNSSQSPSAVDSTKWGDGSSTASIDDDYISALLKSSGSPARSRTFASACAPRAASAPVPGAGPPLRSALSTTQTSAAQGQIRILTPSSLKPIDSTTSPRVNPAGLVASSAVPAAAVATEALGVDTKGADAGDDTELRRTVDAVIYFKNLPPTHGVDCIRKIGENHGTVTRVHLLQSALTNGHQAGFLHMDDRQAAYDTVDEINATCINGAWLCCHLEKVLTSPLVFGMCNDKKGGCSLLAPKPPDSDGFVHPKKRLSRRTRNSHAA